MECRFCLERGSPASKTNPLLSPCICSGSVKYVHKECLGKWRLTTLRPDQDLICPLCKTIYSLSVLRMFVKEMVPVYNRYVTFMTHPIQMFLVWNQIFLLYVFASAVTVEKDTIYYTFDAAHIRLLCVAWQMILATIYITIYSYYVSLVQDRRLYLSKNKQLLLMPIMNGLVLYVMYEYPVAGAILHHCLLPLYLRKHIDTLQIMNGEF